CLGLRVIRIAIRVILHRQAPIGLLYFVLGRILGYAQCFVIISFRHTWSQSKKAEATFAAAPAFRVMQPLPLGVRAGLLLVVLDLLEVGVDDIVTAGIGRRRGIRGLLAL